MTSVHKKIVKLTIVNQFNKKSKSIHISNNKQNY
jgi:hypothetical protein